MVRRTLFYSVLCGRSEAMNREYEALLPLGSSWWCMKRIVFDHVGMRGLTPLVRRPHSLDVLQIHSTPSGPRMSRGSSIRSPVSVSTTTLAHSF
jgi:hypothetical protein